MVVGICSLPLFIPIPLPGMVPGLGLILGMVAIILAAVELKAIARGKGDPESKGFAIAGLVCGIAGVLLGILIIIFFGVIIFTGLAGILATLPGGPIPIPSHL